MKTYFVMWFRAWSITASRVCCWVSREALVIYRSLYEFNIAIRSFWNDTSSNTVFKVSKRMEDCYE